MQHRSTFPGHPSLKSQSRCFAGCRTACQLPRLLCLCLPNLRSVQGKFHIAKHQKHIKASNVSKHPNQKPFTHWKPFNGAFRETHTKAQCFAKLRCHTGYLLREISCKHLPLIQTRNDSQRLQSIQSAAELRDVHVPLAVQSQNPHCHCSDCLPLHGDKFEANSFCMPKNPTNELDFMSFIG